MPWWMIILFGVWASVISVWAYILSQQFLIPRQGIMLTPRPASEGDPPTESNAWPHVCVVIAARNESENIEDCLRDVLAGDYPNLTVCVADDRSEDNTATVVEGIASEDSRVSLQRIKELPSGWMGKSHALWQATRNLETDWFLFLDADCRLEPIAVSTVVREVSHRGVNLLSLWPRHQSGSFWEHLVIPLCGGVTALWFGSTQINDPTSTKAFANGQFLLIQRDAYERIGGHQSVRDAMIEDIPLAEHAKASGLKCWVGGGPALFSVRMYTNLRSIMNGWARIYAGALRSTTKILASFAWLFFGSLWPYLVLFLLIGMHGFKCFNPHFVSKPIFISTVLSVLHLAIMMIVSYRFWGLGGCQRRYLWLYPVSVVMVMIIVLRAGWWLTIKQSIPWRNTVYRINRKGAIGTGLNQDHD